MKSVLALGSYLAVPVASRTAEHSSEVSFVSSCSFCITYTAPQGRLPVNKDVEGIAENLPKITGMYQNEQPLFTKHNVFTWYYPFYVMAYSDVG